MAYPEKVTDLRPDELASPPVVLIDYRYLGGCPDEAIRAVNHLVDIFERLGGGAPRKDVVAYRRPLTASEADRALKIAQDDWIRCSENYGRALKDPSQFSPLLLSEINSWAIKEDRPPIASDQDRL
jgi:hypothetical protein